jgi:hypothetical protein
LEDRTVAEAGGRGHVVLGRNIGGRFNRGSIIPPDTFPEERIDHWVASGVIRRANEDDVEAAKDLQASGSPLDYGSRVNRPTQVQTAEAAQAGRQNRIAALEAQLERLKKEDEELSRVELERARENEEAKKRALEALGRPLGGVDPRQPTEENRSPEMTQSSSDDPQPPDAQAGGRVTRR